MELNLDPAKMYAELKAGTNTVGAIFSGIYIPDWANKNRRIIEIPRGADVKIGDRYYNGTFDRPALCQKLIGNVWVTDNTELADRTRLEQVDSEIRAITIGTVTPKTVLELKAMTVAEYSLWFDANFDTAAKLVGLLKRLTLVFIRRVL